MVGHAAVRAWWPGEGFVRRVPDLEALAQSLDGRLDTWRLVPDEAWDTSWREGFERIDIGGVFAVSPPWKAQAGDVIIEPGMAFGTGEHPSTRACLEAIGRWALPGKRCLDVGCGSGILALSAARLGMEARGIDIDPKVIKAARSNARLNGFDVDFDLIPLDQIEGRFELVVANLYAELQLRLAPHLLRLASSRLVLAGILSEREAMLAPMIRDFETVRIHHTDGWVCLELER